MKKIIYLLFFIAFASCDSMEETIPEDQTFKEDTVAYGDSILNDSVYVNLLNRFYNSPGYYVPVFFKSTVGENTSERLMSKDTSWLYSGEDDTKRIKLSETLSAEMLETYGMDTLLIFNSAQEIIDTLARKHFELFEDMIESEMVASFPASEKDLDSTICISRNGYYPDLFQKSPGVESDSSYFKKLNKRYKFDVAHLFGCGYFVANEDTCAYVSYSDNNPERRNFYNYWFVNGVKQDSMVNEYIIMQLCPVPLRHKDQTYYLMRAGVPDTDHIWHALISWDTKSWEITRHVSNRIHIGQERKPL